MWTGSEYFSISRSSGVSSALGIVLFRVEQGPDGARTLTAVAIVELGDTKRAAGSKEAALGDETGEAARGVGAAGKAEDEDLVAVVVMIDQPLVGVLDDSIDTVAEQAAEETADAFFIIDQLGCAVGAR
jgi:hypothetical protein